MKPPTATATTATTAAFIHHARIIKTLDPLALRDLLLLSCKPTTTTTTTDLSYTRSIFTSTFSSLSSFTFPWNTIIRAHSLSPLHAPHALSFFTSMRRLAVPPDSHTFPFLLRACSRHPRFGLSAHAVLLKFGLFGSPHVGNALVSFYSRLQSVGDAVKVFGEMPKRDGVSWSAVISCFGSNGLSYEALHTFRSMQVYAGGAVVDEITMVAVMTAVTNVAVPELGIWVYFYVLRRGFRLSVSMGTALVAMLGKCGYVDSAVEVFGRMAVRNSRTWTALVVGLAENGRSREAVDAFDRMVEEGNLTPDHIMFIAVLTACSHGGLLDRGQSVFESIEREYGLVPWMEHYGCVVDLFGRAGRVEDAYEFVKKMPVEPNAVIWRTLLGACVNHGRVELAELVRRKIAEIEPGHHGDFVLLSNAFGEAGCWLDKTTVRGQMKDMGIAKTPAWSETY